MLFVEYSSFYFMFMMGKIKNDCMLSKLIFSRYQGLFLLEYCGVL